MHIREFFCELYLIIPTALAVPTPRLRVLTSITLYQLVVLLSLVWPGRLQDGPSLWV